MGVLDIILGRDEQGNASKINMALIALLLWRWYQSAGQSGGTPQPMPSPLPSPRNETPVPDAPARIPTGAPAQTSRPSAGNDSDSDFGPLVESTKRMPDFQRGGGGMNDDGGGTGGGLGGGLGDILNDILRGGQGGPSRGPAGGPGGGRGGDLGDILGDILGGGRGMPGGAGGGRSGPGGGGGLGDILGDILGGGRGAPTSRFAGPQGDSLSALLGGAGGLGGLLAGGAAGGMLGDLLRQFDQSGQGAAARSWVSGGENIPVTPNEIEQTFGSDIIDQLANQFGINKSELLQGLSETLPGVVDQLTPDGRLPTEDEISRWR